MLRPLANRACQHLFAAQAIALVGTGLMTVALGLPAFDLAGGSAGAVLGTAPAIKMAAHVGLAPAARAFSDRLQRGTAPSGRLLCRSAGAADRPAIFAAQFALSHASAAGELRA